MLDEATPRPTNQEQKAELLRQQAIAKICWGARDSEVLEWLHERHGITADAANEILADAHRGKRAAVRSKALLYLIFSIPGMLLPIVFFLPQGMGGFIVVGYGSVLIYIFGFISLGVFFRSVYRLLTGHTQGSVD
jgi:hypothetical protein